MTLTLVRRHDRTLVMCLSVMAALCVAPSGALAQGPRLQLDKLDRLEKQASEVVNVTLDPAMLQLAAAFMSADKRDEAAVKELVTSLRGVYVKSFEFDQEGVYSTADVQAVRDQLARPGWSKLIATESRRERELVEMHIWRQGTDIGGLAILVAEPTELTIVNILGPIDLNKLRALEGQFGIPRLPITRNEPKGARVK